MKYTEQQLVEQFERGVGATFLAVDSFENDPSIVEKYGVDTALGLLDDEMHTVADCAGKLLYNYPSSGLDAYADFGDVIFLVSERLGGINPAFDRLAEKFLHAHYALGQLRVKVYKDNDTIVEKRVAEPCPV